MAARTCLPATATVPLYPTALFIHGFDAKQIVGTPRRVGGELLASQRYKRAVAKLYLNTGDADETFGELPFKFSASYILTYSTNTEFDDACAAVQRVLCTYQLDHDKLVVHAHSMGGLIAVAVFAGKKSPPAAMIFYDTPFGGVSTTTRALLDALPCAARVAAGGAVGVAAVGAVGAAVVGPVAVGAGIVTDALEERKPASEVIWKLLLGIATAAVGVGAGALAVHHRSELSSSVSQAVHRTSSLAHDAVESAIATVLPFISVVLDAEHPTLRSIRTRLHNLRHAGVTLWIIDADGANGDGHHRLFSTPVADPLWADMASHILPWPVHGVAAAIPRNLLSALWKQVVGHCTMFGDRYHRCHQLILDCLAVSVALPPRERRQRRDAMAAAARMFKREWESMHVFLLEDGLGM